MKGRPAELQKMRKHKLWAGFRKKLKLKKFLQESPMKLLKNQVKIFSNFYWLYFQLDILYEETNLKNSGSKMPKLLPEIGLKFFALLKLPKAGVRVKSLKFC